MSNRIPRVRPIPDEFFNMSEEERQEWAQQFLKDFVRPEGAETKQKED